MELMLEYQGGRESLSETTLVVAIDDTGHEEFKDKNHPVFGIGGCAFLVRDYQRLLEIPWNYMCQHFFPEVRRPMHASKLGRPSNEQLQALTHFFEKFQFFRIATVASIKSIKEIDESFIEIIGASLLQQICGIGKFVKFDRLIVIFESSDRIENEVLRSLSGKSIIGESLEIKIELGLMPKSASMPALEVADFIIHTAGAQTRNRISGKSGFRKDFEATFINVDKRLVRFMEITEVKES